MNLLLRQSNLLGRIRIPGSPTSVFDTPQIGVRWIQLVDTRHKNLRSRDLLQRRVPHKKDELKRIMYKSLIESKDIEPSDRLKWVHRLHNLKKNGSPSRIHDRCYLTGKPRGLVKDYGISRIKFREYAHRCILAGVKKAIW
eukprot:TRINITY_DN2728_c0_g2_i1.p2 TRINITY_DN2728_c0_g2~~TRINITY_DN2728_c0_g2_i1.p2  ORF type:complete len:141 (-),score=0.92 TRINITY_DN2728_c0_g2_i1:456-878(-)